MTGLEERVVNPFYLKMMGPNALQYSEELWPELVAVASAVTLDDVRWLLRVGAWRPVVMGAWFSVRFLADDIGADLRLAMSRSQGSFTAVPLAVACVVVRGADALPELGQYVEADAAKDGSTALVAAAIEHLDGPLVGTVSDEDRLDFQELLQIATRLQVS